MLKIRENGYSGRYSGNEKNRRFLNDALEGFITQKTDS